MTGQLTPAERELLETLFDRAQELAPTDHAAFVERECEGNPALRRELERLLAGNAAPDHLARVATGGAFGPGSRVRQYRILELIGAGGMGEVYAAEQQAPLVRRVALKVVRPGLSSEIVLARLAAERQALARMQHPNIAQVHDGGTTEDGRPFFAMELVPGRPITDHCDAGGLDPRARVELFLGACAGVEHAHLKGIIHRDLKPSNMLVSAVDGVPVAKIIDFGIARATEGRLGEDSLRTMPGQIVGTLEYMSPEQLDPETTDVDTRTDVYALGVVLYELLSGARPFDFSRAGDTPLVAAQRAILEQDPPTPSTRLRRDAEAGARAARQRGADTRSLARQLAGDLDWISLKALEKAPARRYQSVAELAADLRRFLADMPVLARRPEWSYRARKFVRRHRAPVIATALIAFSMIAGVVGVVAGRMDAIAAAEVQRASRPYTDSDLHRRLVAEADTELWPPFPDKIGALTFWIERAEVLVAALDGPDGHRADLAAMRASPQTDADYTSRLDALTKLVAALEQMADPKGGLLGDDPAAAAPEHGWSVPRRLAFAEDLRAGFAEGGRHAAAWARYPSIGIPVQMGLVPIGPDPVTGRHEFAHLMTGTPPQRDDHHHIVRTGDMAVVLVLMDADTFHMGAARGDPGASDEPNQERRPPRGCSPVHEVALSAHLLAKYEMTQHQWLFLTGSDPSRYRPGKPTWQARWLEPGRFVDAPGLHPVEQVSWWDCDLWLGRAGLRLPTEAEWEHGARGGTGTPFWTGVDRESLARAANVFDAYARENGGNEHDGSPAGFTDGATMHAPVGSYEANDYGLHDVHGNVWEWCHDGYDIAFYGMPAASRPDPISPAVGDEPRVYRGGAYRVQPAPARASARSYYPPGMKGHALGVRPAATIRR